ncbi:MAG: sigma-70 family RNA polymerase sigma factor, partial [Prevotella conceptionensis]
HELAEEIVDDLFFYLWDNHGQLQVESLQAYLFRSIRNNSEKACRSLAFRKGRVTDSIDNTLLCMHEYLTDPEHPLGWLLEEEMKSTAKQAVNELPRECRQVFELSRYEGKKYSEIAQELGISVNTVKYHIKNAIRILSSRISADVVGVLFFTVVWW